MKDLIKVRIDKSDLTDWYKDQIGSEFFVKESTRIADRWDLVMLSDLGYQLHITKSDCTVIEGEKEEPKEIPYNEKLLIEMWNKRNPSHEYSQEDKTLFWKTAFMVFEDYLKALPHEIPAPEPIGYCIKRWGEKREVQDLNDWANKNNNSNEFRLSSGFLHYNLTTKVAILHPNIIEGFTELFTVEEFFEKVNYKPKYNIKIEVNPLTENHWVKEMLEEQKEEIVCIPFDLKLWESGKYDVVQGNGLKAEVLKIGINNKDYPMAVLCEYYIRGDDGEKQETVQTYTYSGNQLSEINNKKTDLFLIPKTEKVFINLYKGECEYNDKKEAESGALNSNNGLKYYETIEVKRSVK